MLILTCQTLFACQGVDRRLKILAVRETPALNAGMHDQADGFAELRVCRPADPPIHCLAFTFLGNRINFPGHLANGHIVPALATGNTVIFKPTEKAPGVGQLMAEAFHEAGFPAGVFNLVQGEKEVGRRLVVSERIDGVLFTGSYEVGLKIKQDTLQQSWKLLALEMGGKNSALVMNDADLHWAVLETLTGAFITTGQRCSSTSRIMVHKSLFDSFVEKFHERAKAFTIGHPLDNPLMGPLVDAFAVEKYLKFLGIASREGCDVIMRGKQFEADSPGHYVTPSVCLVRDANILSVKKSVYQQTEIFGPNVAIYSFDEPEQAIELANSTHYGLVFSVFSKSKQLDQKVADDLQAGLINWNRSTVGASSRLPFGGLKRSGNHFPTAVSRLFLLYVPGCITRGGRAEDAQQYASGIKLVLKVPRGSGDSSSVLTG